MLEINGRRQDFVGNLITAVKLKASFSVCWMIFLTFSQ